MLSIAPQPDQRQHCYSSLHALANNGRSDLSILSTMALGSNTTSCSSPPTKLNAQASNVAQALEIARDSPDGASDPTVRGILETALSRVWSSITAQPNSYIMTRDEFAVFNYFQHRFADDRIAQQARKRYWDNVSGSS